MAEKEYKPRKFKLTGLQLGENPIEKAVRVFKKAGFEVDEFQTYEPIPSDPEGMRPNHGVLVMKKGEAVRELPSSDVSRTLLNDVKAVAFHKGPRMLIKKARFGMVLTKEGKNVGHIEVRLPTYEELLHTTPIDMHFELELPEEEAGRLESKVRDEIEKLKAPKGRKAKQILLSDHWGDFKPKKRRSLTDFLNIP